MTDVDVVWEADGSIARIRLNRAAKLNALSHAMTEGLAAAVSEISAVSTARVLVTSICGRAFSVGAELHEWDTYDGLAAYHDCLHGQAIFDDLADSPRRPSPSSTGSLSPAVCLRHTGRT